jgi:hypothetical protein
MRQQVLCFVAGASLSAFFIHVGMLATPFFGSGAFLWSNVLAALIGASVLGELVAFARWRQGAGAPLAPLAAIAGILGWLALYLVPLVCRTILDRDPAWGYAPALAVGVIAVIPGAFLSAIVPTALAGSQKEPSPDQEHSTSTRLRIQAHGPREALVLRGIGLAGALLGVALCARAVFRPESANVWLSGYVSAALTVVAALVYSGKTARVVGGIFLAGLVALSAARPSEVQTTEFAVALERAWRAGRGAGSYYLRTADEEGDATLGDDALTAQAKKLKGAERETPGVILACEMLLSLGDVRVKGEGLRRSMDLVLSPEAKPFLLPFFDQIEEINSNGNGLLSVTLRRERGEEGRRFTIPGEKPGEVVNFLFKDDFTIHITRERSVWRLAFGPLTTRRAGIFDLNDTNETPLRVVNAVWVIDASVLGLIFEDYHDRLVVKAVAQGQIGDVKTVEVGTIRKVPKK